MKTMFRVYFHQAVIILGILGCANLQGQSVDSTSTVPSGLTAPLLLSPGSPPPLGISGPGIIDPQGGMVPVGFSLSTTGTISLSQALNGGTLGGSALQGSSLGGGTLTLNGGNTGIVTLQVGSSGSGTLALNNPYGGSTLGSSGAQTPPPPQVLIGNAADNITPEITALAEALNRDVRDASLK